MQMQNYSMPSSSDKPFFKSVDVTSVSSKLKRLLAVPIYMNTIALAAVAIVIYFVSSTLFIAPIVAIIANRGEFDINIIAITVLYLSAGIILSVIIILYMMVWAFINRLAFLTLSVKILAVSAIQIILIAIFMINSLLDSIVYVISLYAVLSVIIFHFRQTKAEIQSKLFKYFIKAKRKSYINYHERYALFKKESILKIAYIAGDTFAIVFYGVIQNSALAILFVIPSLISGIGFALFATRIYIFWTYILPSVGRKIKTRVEKFLRETAITAAQLYEKDRRKKLLFLRSFSDDNTILDRQNYMDEEIIGLKNTKERLEEVITDVGFRYGPVGALSQPGAILPTLGAAKDLSTNEHWQAYVEKQTDEAIVVMCVIGQSEGVRWEIEHAISSGNLGKFVFFLKPINLNSPNLIGNLGSITDSLKLSGTDLRNVIAFCQSPCGTPVLFQSTTSDSLDYEIASTLAIEIITGRIFITDL